MKQAIQKLKEDLRAHLKSVASSRNDIVMIFSFGVLAWTFFFVLANESEWGKPQDVRRFIELMITGFILYFASLLMARHGRWNGGAVRWVVILFFAVIFRLTLVPAGTLDGSQGVLDDLKGGDFEPVYDSFLLYDNDIWRYLWDGRVLIAGVNTYEMSPREIEDLADDGDPRFTWLDDEPWGTIHSRIGYVTYRTVYPPLAQSTFVVSTALFPGSVAAFKLILIAFDIASCWLLLDLARSTLGRPELAMLYAWNPLAIKEIAGSAHIDALVVFFLLLALWLLDRGKERSSLLALAGAILVKLTPLLIVPLFLRRIPWRKWWVLPAAGAVAYAPLIGSLPTIVDSLRAFSRDWAFNAGFWNAALTLGHDLGFKGRGFADAISLGATLALVSWVSWKKTETIPQLAWGAGVILGGYVLLSPTVMPWYLLWALPLLALDPLLECKGSEARPAGPLRVLAWPTITGLSLFSYGVYIDGVERASWLQWEHGLIAAVLLLAFADQVAAAKLGASSMKKRRRRTRAKG